MTKQEEARILLKKWRKAAGERCAGAVLLQEIEHKWRAELCWASQRGGLQYSWKVESDPLTAVHAAIKQTPWPTLDK